MTSFMARFALLALFFAHTTFGLALPGRSSGTGFIDPVPGGGSWLDSGDGKSGEPLNVVISGLSSPKVLDFVSDDGFLNFARALAFSKECLGLHSGGLQSANLGDGRGGVNQTIELREEVGRLPIIGTCLESLAGGNHLRVFPQPSTGALFLAVSEEENLSQRHTISPNGYDLGRDNFVRAALNNPSHDGVSYEVTVQNYTTNIPPGFSGTNHGIAIDGVAQILTVMIK